MNVLSVFDVSNRSEMGVKMIEKIMNEETWDSTYQPIMDSQEEGSFVQEYDEIKDVDVHHVWSLIDGSDTDSIFVLPGFRLVNVIAYVETKVPWVTGDEEAFYYDSEGELK